MLAHSILLLREVSSKSLLVVLRKWSDSLLRCGHGKPFRVKVPIVLEINNAFRLSTAGR